MNVSDIANEIPDRSFDCVVALDLIEHLTKEDGRRLLRAMERIARRKVVIFTPQGFLPQHAVGRNEFQRHLSGWEVDEMRGMGYRVIGISGWKPLKIIGPITETATIATGHGVRIRSYLNKIYGRGNWRKLKGEATIEFEDGTTRRAEIHWYEAHGIGKKDFKIKRYLEWT
jgi:hypothetical protein